MESHYCFLCIGTLKDPLNLIKMKYDGVIKTFIRGFDPTIEVLVIATECITARIKDGVVFDPESVEIACDAVCEWRHDFGEQDTPISEHKMMKLETLKSLELLIRSTENADVVMTKSASKT
jgi:hypothetical protein